MKTLKISEAAAACGGRTDGEGTVSCVCIDTREIKAGCLFFCIEGERFDGHAFARQAAEQGAGAVVCHKPVSCGVPVIEVEDTRAALMRLAGWYRRQFDIPVVGLTGSVGKTTTKEMTHAVLSKCYKTLKTEGNRNNEIGLPLTVFHLDDSFRAAVLEMGMSSFGEISRLSCAASPSLGIITNIGVSHMEHLGSQENILKAKLELLDGLQEYAPLLLNGDDPFLRSAKIEGRPVFYYGIESDCCRIKAHDIEQMENYTSFVISFGGIDQKVTLPTVGRHNIYNALAAYGAGVIFGVSPYWAAQALAEYEPTGMRQRVRRIAGRTVIEDCYNASPDSMRAALAALQALPARRKIAVLGDMLELGEISAMEHYKVGALVAGSGVDRLYTYGKQSLETARAAREDGMAACFSFSDQQQLADALLRESEPGDALLFKASRGMRLEETMQALYEGWTQQ